VVAVFVSVVDSEE
jgi:hypothetical protein